MHRSLPVLLGGMLFAVLGGCTQPTPSTPEAGATAGTAATPAAVELLNVSYDPTRELWKDLNTAFAKAHLDATGQTVTLKQSHAASGSQARAVIDGLEADIVSLALWSDTEQLHKKGLIKDGWEDRFPNRSLPYSSTIVFVVRKGNPKGIKDWPDLVKPGVEVITPNPKTSGNGKLAFLAAWGSVVLGGGTEDQAKDFITRMYRQTPVLDTGARGATTTFAQKGIGDVHLTWESEAHLEVEEAGGELEMLFPSLSILAEPHVAVVDANVDPRGKTAVAEAYLNFLYTDAGQDIIAKHYYRPSTESGLARHQDRFPTVKLFRITEIATGWDDAQTRFFAEGALFDSIYKAK